MKRLGVRRRLPRGKYLRCLRFLADVNRGGVHRVLDVRGVEFLDHLDARGSS
jgi:hypothetical protein